MDATVIKALLDSQERAYKSALEVVIKQMNDQMAKMDNKISDLTTSLEFTQREVDELKKNIKTHEKEQNDAKITKEKLTQQVETSDLKISELVGRVNQQEDYSRRMNVRFIGVEENANSENWEQTAVAVNAILEDKMQLPGVVLERAHRVGPRRDNKPRTIVARFSR